MHMLRNRILPLFRGTRVFSSSGSGNNDLTNLLEKLKGLTANPKRVKTDTKRQKKHVKNDKDLKNTIQSTEETKLSNLLEALGKHVHPDASGKPLAISDIFAGVKVDKVRINFRPELNESVRAKGRGQYRNTFLEGPALDIFSEKTIEGQRAAPSESLFDRMTREGNESLVRALPRNSFEEAIELTKEGKLWSFPIDNEQGMEAKESFHEHVFLERFLPLFPNKGPVRHFAELALVGLSKNHHLSVQEKEEHARWFADYFKEHPVDD